MPPRRGSPSSRRTMRGLVSMASATRATLVFDGDCAICRSWVSYWQRLTNGRVIYRPYQEAAADFPTIPREAFERAIWLIESDGGSTRERQQRTGCCFTHRATVAGGGCTPASPVLD